jgi:Holliday junction resolvase RusA-like endonuclease
MIQFIIPGDVPSLKNSNGMNRRGQRFDNAAVKAYKRDFAYLVPAEFRGRNLGSKDQLLGISIALYHADWRRDVDCEIILDCLQAAGVVSNDRWFRYKAFNGARVDPRHPRAEIQIWELGKENHGENV